MNISEAYWKCVESTADYAKSYGMSDCVLGLSGGIDSALVCALATDAFGADHVHAVIIPGPFTSGASVVDATDAATRMGVDLLTVSINAPYEAFVHELSNVIDTQTRSGQIALQNIQARCRMVELMALSNAREWMMLNCGNRTERLMGYCTIYGDMAGAYAPIGALYKTQVYAFAQYVNERALNMARPMPIPASIINRAPSAELAAGQTDEASLGITYELLDKFLVAHIDMGMSADQLCAAGFAQSDIDNVLAHLNAASWKQKFFPPHPFINIAL